MLHTLFVAVLLFFALFETFICFLPTIESLLKDSKLFGQLKNYLGAKVEEIKRNNNKYALIALSVIIICLALFTIAGSLGSIFFEFGLSLYALCTNLGPKLFAIVILGLSSYQIYNLIRVTKMMVALKDHEEKCECEACATMRKKVEEEKKEEDVRVNPMRLLLFELPCALYNYYILYLIW